MKRHIIHIGDIDNPGQRCPDQDVNGWFAYERCFASALIDRDSDYRGSLGVFDYNEILQEAKDMLDNIRRQYAKT